MSDLGSKPTQFPAGSSGNAMVDGASWDWEAKHGLEPDDEPMPESAFISNPAIQEGVNSIYEIIMDTQAIMEAILSMPIDAIERFKARIYEALEEFREELI